MTSIAKLTLSDPLIRKVFSFVPAHDLYERCAAVCTRWLEQSKSEALCKPRLRSEFPNYTIDEDLPIYEQYAQRVRLARNMSLGFYLESYVEGDEAKRMIQVWQHSLQMEKAAFPDRDATCMKFLDKNRIVVGKTDALEVWDTSTRELLKRMPTESKPICIEVLNPQEIAVVHDSALPCSRTFSGRQDALCIWNLESEGPPRTFPLGFSMFSQCRRIIFTTFGKIIFEGDSDIKIVDTRSMKWLHSFQGPRAWGCMYRPYLLKVSDGALFFAVRFFNEQEWNQTVIVWNFDVRPRQVLERLADNIERGCNDGDFVNLGGDLRPRVNDKCPHFLSVEVTPPKERAEAIRATFRLSKPKTQPPEPQEPEEEVCGCQIS